MLGKRPNEFINRRSLILLDVWGHRTSIPNLYQPSQFWPRSSLFCGRRQWFCQWRGQRHPALAGGYRLAENVSPARREVDYPLCTSFKVETWLNVERSSCSEIARSYFVCKFIQNCADVPKKRARRRAVSAVMLREPCTISFIRRDGTFVDRASRYWVT